LNKHNAAAAVKRTTDNSVIMNAEWRASNKRTSLSHGSISAKMAGWKQFLPLRPGLLE
jgi:hypothetical protein